ncbi:MAG: hypothetical protein M1610_01485 [Nitrospirae bacterium]|nr:hypothetical protein [Nitrospirota bacterium]MDA8338469.1 hypothetical protein [Nitrospiraceae bacterium]
MRTETLHLVEDYMAELFSFVVDKEGFAEGLPYFDTANPKRATIGYGFNIEADTDNLLLVLEQMGIVNDKMTTFKITTIRNEFQTAINNTPHTGSTDTINAQLRANLNKVASRYGVATFQIDKPQGYTVFREIIEGTKVGNIPIQGKQERLDALLQDSLAHNSKEYIAVMSLFYNGESLVDSKQRLLANAIIKDNRAEAWFEIRYNSNNGSNRSALAQRRYRESDLFGLLDSGAFTDEGTKEVFRMYTKHRSEIDKYENNFPPPSSAYFSISAPVLQAKEYLVNKFGQGKTIDNIIVGAGLESYAYQEKWTIDKIFGTGGNELIFGEKGEDYFLMRRVA